ncbi:histidine kinase [Planococcus sp. CPCC 101016]|uniref:histidine kinase n=1 Tax=Planococcus sp. CPCC 101016 TaxID=2599617 RepID=UPI0021BDB8F6|nr:histidine kinase [Planococcus sp. CPCC 101016]
MVIKLHSKRLEAGGGSVIDKQELLFKQLKEIKDYWVETANDGLNEDQDMIWSQVEEEYKVLRTKITSQAEREAYQKVVDEVIKGVMHSVLVMIDGGDELAENVLIDLTERDTNESLSGQTALHEEFFGYLLDTEDE